MAVVANDFGSAAAQAWFLAQLRDECSTEVKTVLAAFVKQQMEMHAGSPDSAFLASLKTSLPPKDVTADMIDDAVAKDNSLLAVRLKSLDDAVAALSTKTDEALKAETLLDSKLEWRKYERECPRREWSTAWDRLLVKIDSVDQQADAMEDPAVSNTMAVVLQNPGNEEAKRLLEAVTFRKAKKKEERSSLLEARR